MMRILIVDDEPSICQIVSTMLRFEGFEVDTAPDGRLALQRLGDAPPDVVLSDVSMPHLDGFGLLAAIRANPALAKVRVVLATGLADGEGDDPLALSQADARITKPFSRDQLLTVLRSLGR